MGIGLGFASIQRGLGDEFRQRIDTVFHLEIRQRAHQFFQVLYPRLALLAFFAGVVVLQATGFDGLFHQALQ